MFSTRPYPGRMLLSAVLMLALAGRVAAQAGARSAIVVRESSNGVTLASSAGPIGNPRVLRLGNPDRLVLDFENISPPAMTREEAEHWRRRGVRFGFHAEDQTTRVVFDIPGGQQRWIKWGGGAVQVRYRDPDAKEPQVVAERPPQRTVPAVPAATQYVAQHRKPAVPTPAPAPVNHLDVSYRDGLLKVSARGVSFDSVLQKIISETGASLQLIVPVDNVTLEAFEYGPASPVDVIRQLFTGTEYNYILITEPNSDTKISRIVVTSYLQKPSSPDQPVSESETNLDSVSGVAPIPDQQTPPQDQPIPPQDQQNDPPSNRPPD